uniref:Triacylglycerol lipase n=1 Tax=Echinococcus granulosus TaxID=6210 RepID=A0A7E4SZI0_ECHGR
LCNTTIPTTCPTAVSTGVLDTAQSATHYQQNMERMMQTNVVVNSIDVATHLVGNGQVRYITPIFSVGASADVINLLHLAIYTENVSPKICMGH